MIYTQKAAVLYNNVWQLAIGTLDRGTADFIFVLNAKMGRVPKGQCRTYPMDYPDIELEREVIALNINFLTRNRRAWPKTAEPG